MAKLRAETRVWLKVDGTPPGVEYAEEGGQVWVRDWNDDQWNEFGPVPVTKGDVASAIQRLLGEIDSLYEMRDNGPGKFKPGHYLLERFRPRLNRQPTCHLVILGLAPLLILRFCFTQRKNSSTCQRAL